MKNQEILNKLKKKSVTKQNVYNTNYDLFKSLKETTKKLVLELNKEESLKENNVIIKFKENNKFEFQLQFSGDVLILCDALIAFSAKYSESNQSYFSASCVAKFT